MDYGNAERDGKECIFDGIKSKGTAEASEWSGKEEAESTDVEFFLDRDGIEIGLNFNYPPEDPHDLGYSWVTAPFSYKEIKQYISDKEFWKYFWE